MEKGAFRDGTRPEVGLNVCGFMPTGEPADESLWRH
jgi:hypothetical protein